MGSPPKPEFRRYRATRDVTVRLVVGAPSIVIRAGDVVEYDGTHLRLGPGRSAAAPTLAGAISIGWLVPADP